MDYDYTDSELERELDATEGVSLSREVRRDIFIRYRRNGETQSQICDDLNLPRHLVRSVVNPEYRNPRQAKQKPSLVDDTDEQKYTKRQRALMSEREKKRDLNVSSEQCIEDLRRVQRENPDRYVDRNDYRILGAYSDASWNQHFGTFQEFRRQAGLELSRYQHDVERKVAKHASLDHYRSFFCSEIQPYVAQYPRIGPAREIYTVLAGSDFHDLDADRFSLAVFIDTAKRLQPDVILLNGDVFDLYEFSRFQVDPRKIAVRDRFDFVSNEIFRPLRLACPDAQIDFLLGNHEWRLLRHVADRTPNMPGILSDVMGFTLEDIFRVREYEINLHCKWDFSAYTKRDIEDQLRQNYIVYWNSLVACHFPDPSFKFGLSWVAGHTHRPEQLTRRNLNGRLTGTTMGSIASTDAHYIEGLDQAMNGFSIHHIMPRTGQVSSENILIPGDFVAVAGKYYFADC